MIQHDDLVRIRKKLEKYQPPDDVRRLLDTTPIVLLVGIAGAGKDTVKSLSLDSLPHQYHHVVSHTTRRIRPGEKDGVDYHFIDVHAAEAMIDNHGFIEAKIVHERDVYGTSMAEIEMAHDEGRIAISDVEVQGVEEFIRLSPRVKPVFILPPDYESWQHRLRSRYGHHWESRQDEIKRRMRSARMEIEDGLLAHEYFSIVVNRDLHDAVAEVDRLARDDTAWPHRSDEGLAIAWKLLRKLKEQGF